MAYILDADWAIQALAGRQQEIDTLTGHAQEGIAISWVTVGEICEGAFGSPDPQTHLQAFREFLAPLVILNLNDPIMEQFANLRTDLRRRGELIPDFDIILGATALYYDLTVLTHDIRHFSRIPDLKLYRASESRE